MLTHDPSLFNFLGIIPSIKSGVANSNMAASRTADVTVCSGTLSFSLSNSGLSVDSTGMARLAEGDNLLKKRKGSYFKMIKKISKGTAERLGSLLVSLDGS